MLIRPAQGCDTTMKPPRGNFPTTHPSELAKVGQQEHDSEDWNSLVTRYYRPMRYFLLSVRFEALETDDLLQEFFARKKFQNAVMVHDPGLGRFRGQLMRALRCYLIDELRKLNAAKRVAVRASRSLDVPAHADEPEGASLGSLIADRAEQVNRQQRLLDEHLRTLLKDFPKSERAELYLEWIKTDEQVTNEDFAREHGLNLDQWNYRKGEVEQWLKDRRDRNEGKL